MLIQKMMRGLGVAMCPQESVAPIRLIDLGDMAICAVKMASKAFLHRYADMAIIVGAAQVTRNFLSVSPP